MSTTNDCSKRCTVCKVEYPATTEYFHRQKGGKNGLQASCKNCDKTKKAKWYIENAKEERVRQAQYRAEHSEEKKAYSLNWTREHKKEKKAYDAKYHAEHFEETKARQAKYEREHPEKAKVKTHRRRAAKHALPSQFTANDWLRCLEAFGNTCAVCGRPAGLWHTLAADHWIALTDPAPDNPGTVPHNIVPLCHGVGGCNNSKLNKNAELWLVEKFGKREASKILSRIHAYFDSLKQTP